jgi:hypothetical protein
MSVSQKKLIKVLADTVGFYISGEIVEYTGLTPDTSLNEILTFTGVDVGYRLLFEDYLKDTIELEGNAHITERLNHFIFMFLTLGYINVLTERKTLVQTLTQLGINTGFQLLVFDNIESLQEYF